MALCAFCEENVTTGAVRRGEHTFCSNECADSYFMTYADDDESNDAERMSLDIDDLDGDGYDDDDDDNDYNELRAYSSDYLDEDEAY